VFVFRRVGAVTEHSAPVLVRCPLVAYFSTKKPMPNRTSIIRFKYIMAELGRRGLSTIYEVGLVLG
jgi:hypothetical protein